MDQILPLAPSIEPDIEPLVSRTKATSSRAGASDAGCGAAPRVAEARAWATGRVAETSVVERRMCTLRRAGTAVFMTDFFKVREGLQAGARP
jgi:hypothetical protein